jgi:hypothetical protein
LAFTVGLVIVRLVVLALRKWVVRGADLGAIAIRNAIALLIVALLGGFGIADGGPPEFQKKAFVSYLLAVLISYVWDVQGEYWLTRLSHPRG